jgi:TM2 domain-containing membrane protein YozV
MPLTDSIHTANMTDQQRSWFYAEYQRASKDELLGVLLALLGGTFGLHHFYLRRNDLGILYLLLSWTGIPAILGFIECFFMPARVRQYNSLQAIYISHQILAHTANPYTAPTCPSCGAYTNATAAFCQHCGATIPHPPLNPQPAI